MGIEAWQKPSERRCVAHGYAVIDPLLSGFIAFGCGAIAHHVTRFSPGGVVLKAEKF